MTNYGSLIKEAREKAGLTQEELGKAIGVTGVAIMRYEKGQRTPSSKIIGEITKVLGADFAALVIKEVEQSVAVALDRKKQADAEFDERISKRISELESAEERKVADFVNSPIGKSIIYIFHKLNELGQDEAEKRLYELAEIPKYKRIEPTESQAESQNTTQTKKPPQDSVHPHDS